MLSKALKQKGMDIGQLSEEEVVKADDAVTPPAYTTEMKLTQKEDGFVTWSLGLLGFRCRPPSKHEQVCVYVYDVRFLSTTLSHIPHTHTHTHHYIYIYIYIYTYVHTTHTHTYICTHNTHTHTQLFGVLGSNGPIIFLHFVKNILLLSVVSIAALCVVLW